MNTRARLVVACAWLTALTLSAQTAAETGDAAPAEPPTPDIWQLAADGDVTFDQIPFQGFGPVAVVAASYTLDPAAGWQAGDTAQTLQTGSFQAELRDVGPDWAAVHQLLPKISADDHVEVRKIAWSGISTWLVDCELPANVDPRQRYLVAPTAKGFLVLAFRGPDRLGHERLKLRDAALSVHFTAHGLIAEFYSGMEFARLVGTQVDAAIDFNWNETAPGYGLDKDVFSIRWRTTLTPKQSARYTFTTVSDDGVRLKIDDQVLVENWTDHAEVGDSGEIELLAGQPYKLEVEWYENTIYAVARLLWETAELPRQIVPPAVMTATPEAGFALAPAPVGERAEEMNALPPLLDDVYPAGYKASKPKGMRWDGEMPRERLEIGADDEAVQVRLTWLPLNVATAREAFPATVAADQIKIRSILWNDIGAWSADVALDAAAHPAVPLRYQRLYVVPLQFGVVTLSFAAGFPDWREYHHDDFMAVLDSLSFTDERPEALHIEPF